MKLQDVKCPGSIWNGGGRAYNQMAENMRESVAPRGGEERENVRQVLDPNKNPQT